MATRTGHELASGETNSCGCLQKEVIGALRRTHGISKTPTYRSWQAAKDRCHNPLGYLKAAATIVCDVAAEASAVMLSPVCAAAKSSEAPDARRDVSTTMSNRSVMFVQV